MNEQAMCDSTYRVDVVHGGSWQTGYVWRWHVVVVDARGRAQCVDAGEAPTKRGTEAEGKAAINRLVNVATCT